MYMLTYQKENLKKEIMLKKKEKKSNCMPSVGNTEGHQNIGSTAFAGKCFSKEAGVVLSFSSFDYLVSLTSLYVRLCKAQRLSRMRKRHSRVARVLQRFVFHIIC